MAAKAIVPKRRLIVSMAIGNGYYHYFDDEEPVSPHLLNSLCLYMRDIVAKNLTIQLLCNPQDSVFEYFEQSNQAETFFFDGIYK